MLDRAAMVRAFDAAEKAFGTVTILVNNAGITHADRVHRHARGDLAPRDRHQSRCGALLGAGGRAAHDRRQEAGRDRQHRVDPRLRRLEGRRRPMRSPRPAWCSSPRRSRSSSPSRACASTPSRRASSSPRSTTSISKGRAPTLTRNIPVGRFGETGDLDGALLLLVSDAGALHGRRDGRGRRRADRWRLPGLAVSRRRAHCGRRALRAAPPDSHAPAFRRSSRRRTACTAGDSVARLAIAGPGQRPTSPQPTPNSAAPAISGGRCRCASATQRSSARSGRARRLASQKPGIETASAAAITIASVGSQPPFGIASTSRKPSTARCRSCRR